ncbi:hypothetical protein ACFLTA_02520 [Bacteroidota bacterium]
MHSKKITVKHYLNKRAKPKIYRKEEYYPLYIQLIVDAKKAQIKSRINQYLGMYHSDIEGFTRKDTALYKLIISGYFTEKLLDRINGENIFPIAPLLEDEVAVITKIIVLQKPFENKQFTLNHFSAEYEKHVTEITEILDDSIKGYYRKNLNKLFLESVDKDEQKKTFNISNFFIHYINWNFPFSNFYEITYEVIPSELKYIENHIEQALHTSIKAYMAYHSKVNIVKRYMDKQDDGRISTLSYLDWITDIKEFVINEFTKLFGRKKALEYVSSLDRILERKIHNSG